jgi:transcriptional regulator with XRE-family HTH domain
MASRYRPIDRLQESIETNAGAACFEFPRGGANKLANLIKEQMKKQGLSMAALSRKGGLNDTFVSSFKCARQKGISVQTLLRFAKAFDVDPLWLGQHLLLYGFKEPAPLVKVEPDVEVITPEKVQKDLTTRGVMMSINGVQMLAEQVHEHAVPAIVEHAGWRMTLIPT